MRRITKKEIDAKKEMVRDFDRRNLLPAGKYAGMRDFLSDFVGYGDEVWLDVRNDIMESLALDAGGHLVRTGIVSSPTMHFAFGLDRANDFNTRANHYDLYLCSDGRIRYWTDPDIEREIDDEVAEIAAEYERELAKEFEDMIMHTMPVKEVAAIGTYR